MSTVSVRLVTEFFFIHDWLVLAADDVLMAKNPRASASVRPESFVIEKEVLPSLRNMLVKPVGWHTLKFAPSVLRKSPEIFTFLNDETLSRAQSFFEGESFLRVLVIPGLPASGELRRASIEFMRERGIDAIIRFTTVIAGLVEKINSRQVYLSETNELLRILKFYRFFPSEPQQTLPFEEK